MRLSRNTYSIESGLVQVNGNVYKVASDSLLTSDVIMAKFKIGDVVCAYDLLDVKIVESTSYSYKIVPVMYTSDTPREFEKSKIDSIYSLKLSSLLRRL